MGRGALNLTGGHGTIRAANGIQGGSIMIFKPLNATDKTGHEVLLRNAEAGDAEDLIHYLKTTASETPYLIREPDEAALTPEQEREFIQRMMDSPRDLLLAAFVDGKHAGNCSLNGIGAYRRYRHRCEIAIALYQEYCGRGIGTMMLNAVLETAKEIGYEQAELEVIADNKGAVALYEKLGFQKYGRFPDNAKYQTGNYADAYWMMKKL